MAVTCPKCRSENTDSAKFCSNCAAQLVPGGQPIAVATKTLESPPRTLTKGSLIAGKYRILDEIGRGGMGVVYKAEDIKLARQVAVKVLPEEFIKDPERLARFEREAKVLASLNHPNIASIYGVEEVDGKRFLILELVEGEALDERLSRGPLSLEETLGVCGQIAEGLEAAHEKGIVHRDLKPSNVKITLEGKAKILDFGLAKAHVEELTAVDIANSPTITAQMTEAGVILGTAAYMSPEQARGRPVDRRSDIWAFGCILYECLTGKRAFPGDTATESMAAILRGEPDWGLLPAGIPYNVLAVLRRCLDKDRDLRYHDVADAWLEIGSPMASPSEAVPTRRQFPLLWLAAGAVAVLMAGVLAGRALFRRPQAPSSSSPITTTIKVEPEFVLDGMRSSYELDRPSRTAVAVSGDGKFIIYSAVEEKNQPGAADEHLGPQAKARLFLRRMDQPKAEPISGSEGGINPFLSPDNKWVGFWADDKLKKVPVSGGIPNTICDTSPLVFGASWGPASSIVFTDGADSGLSRVSADGGKPEIITKPDPAREELSHRLPSWLPNGKAVLFTVMRHAWDQRPWLCLLRLDTREWKTLLEDAADARYVPTGCLVFLRQGALMAVRFDLGGLRVIGQPVPLVGNVMQSLTVASDFNTSAGQYSVSDNGILIYAAGGIAPDRKNSLVWVDQKGAEQSAAALQSPFFAPRLSPDGQKIAYGTQGREWQIWIYDLVRGTNSLLTRDGFAIFPIWSPDGQRLLFGWQRSHVANLFWQPYDGSSPMVRLTTSELHQNPASWSPDGKTIVLAELHPETNWDIELLDAASGRMTPFLNAPYDEWFPELSPDGRWLAYSSDESKRYEVYVRAIPGPGVKQQVSNGGGIEPMWSRDGQRLFYRWQDQVWAVDVRTDGGFSIGKPRLLFEKPLLDHAYPLRGYDLSLDSQRFLMVKQEQRKPTPVTEMTIVQNWFEEIKRLVPAGKE